jgi:hypothetical protein
VRIIFTPEGWFKLRLALLFFVLATASGCSAARQVQQQVQDLTIAGQYDAALLKLDASQLAKSSSDRLLFLMTRGLLLHEQGRYEQSNAVFEQAELLSEELFTRSISAGTLSFLTNDQIVAYVGADYEVAYLNYYKALNYLALGNLEAAGVEARRVDLKLRQFTDAYEGKNVFKEDGLLRLLTGLIYQAQGDWNNAFIAYRLALESFNNNRSAYGVPVPEILWSLLTTTAQRSGLLQERDSYRDKALAQGITPITIDALAVVLINSGKIPMKRERMVLFPTRHGFPVKLALPEFVPRQSHSSAAYLWIDNLEVPAQTVENLAAIAAKSLDDQIGRVLAKAIARTVAKELAARKMEHQQGSGAGMLVRIFNVATENADLRSWLGLPARVLLAAAPVPPGDHGYRLVVDGATFEGTLAVPPQGVGFVFHRTY